MNESLSVLLQAIFIGSSYFNIELDFHIKATNIGYKQDSVQLVTSGRIIQQLNLSYMAPSVIDHLAY